MEISATKNFIKDTKHISSLYKIRLEKIIQKLIEQPQIGKPLKNDLANERSIRLHPFRLLYTIKDNTILLLRFEHRKKVYLQSIF